MTEKPEFMMQTYIRHSHEALTDPAQMSAHHFLCSHVTLEGRTGTYHHADCTTRPVNRTPNTAPKSRIEAMFEPHWEPGIPASRQVFRRIPDTGDMKLVIEHYDLHVPVAPGEGVADGRERRAAGLKTHLETGDAQRLYEAEAL